MSSKIPNGQVNDHEIIDQGFLTLKYSVSSNLYTFRTIDIRIYKYMFILNFNTLHKHGMAGNSLTKL